MKTNDRFFSSRALNNTILGFGCIGIAAATVSVGWIVYTRRQCVLSMYPYCTSTTVVKQTVDTAGKRTNYENIDTDTQISLCSTVFEPCAATTENNTVVPTKDRQSHHNTADQTQCMIHSFSKKYVEQTLHRIKQMITERFMNKNDLMDILSRATDAITIVLSHDTWFTELCNSVQNQHKIAGLSLKCPLTIRVDDGEECHSLLLNAFAEYDIRLDNGSTLSTRRQEFDETTEQQIRVQNLIEAILAKQCLYSVKKNIACTLSCELCESEDLSQLVGLPLANHVSTNIASQLLMPNRWDFSTEDELRQFVYAQCVQNNEMLHYTMTPDRVLCMMNYPVDENNTFAITENAQPDREERESSSVFDYNTQSLVAVLCHWEKHTSRNTDTETKNRTAMVESIVHLTKENGCNGKCVLYQSACCLIVPQSIALCVNNRVHQIGSTHKTPIQTFIVQVQNRASAQHTPRLTCVTMIEVV